jgi:hypothetical protein
MGMIYYPKDGSVFTTLTPKSYRWKRYKPDRAKQMKAEGRWQQCVFQGDFFKWENCGDPVGEITETREIE